MMEAKLSHYHQHFEEVLPGILEGSDVASELELLHYMYLCGSETKLESQFLWVLGKKPFCVSLD
jgi:hypothetical protein